MAAKKPLPMEGSWLVDVDDTQPDMVYVQFTEPDEENAGLRTYGFYLPRGEAEAFAQAVYEKAQEVRYT